MSPEERKYIKTIDETILNASPKELKRIQELDKQIQLEGSFYDSYYILNHPKQNFSQNIRTKKNR